MPYIAILTGRKLPVIFECTHLAALLGRTPAYLASVINDTKAHYRSFDLKKRLGGKRTIFAPYPALLECQQWINDQILRRAKIHPASHGFIRDKSIKTNALRHLGKECLLKLDLQDFFPSIGISRVISIFQRLGYAPNVSLYLAKICCLDDVLPQGASTSPALSNAIAFSLDNRLDALAKTWKVTYTRYADDLTFSGDFSGDKLLKCVSDIITDEGFVVNAKKTRFSAIAGKRIVTGISIAGNEVKIPLSYKRKLRQELHFLMRFGAISHMTKRKIRNPFYLDSLYGKVRFWLWVEPDNSFAGEAALYLEKLLAARNFL